MPQSSAISIMVILSSGYFARRCLSEASSARLVVCDMLSSFPRQVAAALDHSRSCGLYFLYTSQLISRLLLKKYAISPLRLAFCSLSVWEDRGYTAKKTSRQTAMTMSKATTFIFSLLF